MRDKDKELIGRNLGFHGYLLDVPMIHPDDRLTIAGLDKDPDPCVTVWRAVLDFRKEEVLLPLGRATFGDIIRLAEAIILYREVYPGQW